MTDYSEPGPLDYDDGSEKDGQPLSEQLENMPCPYCKVAPELEEQADTGFIAVVCPDCGAHGGWTDSDQYAIDDWQELTEAIRCYRAARSKK